MKELKAVFSAILYVICQLVVVVLKPVLGAVSWLAEKCAAVASQELAKLAAPAPAPAPVAPKAEPVVEA